MGCIGFFEYSPLLEKELGLIPMIHYVPCTELSEQLNKNNKLITDVNYYNYYLNNIDGKGLEIAENGKEHIRKYFSNNNGINNYLKIFKNI